jgi:hypothetical protein
MVQIPLAIVDSLADLPADARVFGLGCVPRKRLKSGRVCVVLGAVVPEACEEVFPAE